MPGGPAAHQQFDRLWNAAPSGAANLWAEAKKASEAGGRFGRQLLRLQFDQLLLERASADSPESFRHARRLAQVLAEPAGLAPTEVHQLVMLARDLPAGPPRPTCSARRCA